MSWFCFHDYRVWGTQYGENALGIGTYAVVFCCVKCGRFKRDIGWTESGAEAQVEWLKKQQTGGPNT